MVIIGCDFHPSFQQVAVFDKRTGEIEERRLSHRVEAEDFYRSLAGQPVRVGMEACGHYPWFERLPTPATANSPQTKRGSTPWLRPHGQLLRGLRHERRARGLSVQASS